MFSSVRSVWKALQRLARTKKTKINERLFKSLIWEERSLFWGKIKLIYLETSISLPCFHIIYQHINCNLLARSTMMWAFVNMASSGHMWTNYRTHYRRVPLSFELCLFHSLGQNMQKATLDLMDTIKTWMHRSSKHWFVTEMTWRENYLYQNKCPRVVRFVACWGHVCRNP